MTTLLIRLIYFYRWVLSPFKKAPSCRFHPTCSAYAISAIQLHGPAKGLWLALKRLFRCHPVETLGGGWGFDPVPHNNRSHHLKP